MSEQLVFQPSAAAIARTRTTKAQYDEMYARSISDPDGFWAEQAKRLSASLPHTRLGSELAEATS